MVCLGNICRSPLAEGILQRKVEEKDLNWQIDSAGTGSWHVGELPDSRSIDVGEKYGVDLKNQRARQFKKIDLDRFDLIFAMDSSNYQNILKLADNQAQKDKVKLIMNEADPGRNEAVPDPYWDDDGFEKVYQMLDKACTKLVEKYNS